MDFNILNRAEFQESDIDLAIICIPGKTTNHSYPLPNGAICLKGADWKYEVPGGQEGSWPKQALQLTIIGAFTNATARNVTLNPPVIIREKIDISINNPSAVQVTLHLKLMGTLIKNIGNAPLTNKEILGYTLLDNNQRGLLALEEAARDRVQEYLKELGVEGNIENRMLTSYPEVKALEDSKVNPENLQKILLGELVQFTIGNNISIDNNSLNELATYLIDKGWSR